MKKADKDYSDYVLKTYEQKKLAEALSWRMIHLSPADIRDECLEVCLTRYSKKDEECLKNFFGENVDKKAYPNVDKEAYLQAIERCRIGKFKPLRSFINGDTNDPNYLIVELLAWLLDIQPRPYWRWKEAGGTIVQPPTNGNGPAQESGGEEDPPSPKEPEKIISNSEKSGNPDFKSITKVVIASAIEVMVVCVLTWALIDKPFEPHPPGQQKCMYWKDDHYEPVSCSQKVNGALVIALDSLRLTKFKRITKWDTITKKDIGKVWYIKLNRRLEYFTDTGAYPLDLKLRVRPITEYIIDKYILNRQAPD